MSFYKTIKNNTGAMFGVDARIAMAIFSSLTVIFGYIAFGKLKSAKDVALIRELADLNTAIQNYQTDMGTFYQFTISSSNGVNDFAALYDINRVSSGYRNSWNGPYFSTSNNQHITYGLFTLTYSQANRSQCTSTSDCYVWIQLTDIRRNMWDKINSFVDESLGSKLEIAGQQTTTGRVQAGSNSDPLTIYYRSVKRIK